MKRILIFGDSFSCEFKHMCKEYVEWKKYEPENFGEIISKKLNLDYLNYAIGGIDNYTIFHSIIKNDINDDDILIIGWTNPSRFRLVDNPNNSWMTFLPTLNYDNFYCISKNTINEIFYNRVLNDVSHPLCVDEVNDFINIINKAYYKNKIIHWSWYEADFNLTLDALKYDKIIVETNGDVVDYHMTEFYSKILSEKMLKFI